MLSKSFNPPLNKDFESKKLNKTHFLHQKLESNRFGLLFAQNYLKW